MKILAPIFAAITLSACVVPVVVPIPAKPSSPGPAPIETAPAPSKADNLEQFKGRYSALDRHALAAPASVERDPDALLAYLLKPARTDEDKARVIYRWLTSRFSYDVASFKGRTYTRQSLEQLMRSRSGVCDGFATAMTELGRKAGLTIRTIEGRAKGGTNGELFAGNRPNHAWNMVQLDGHWKIIDATWGAGHVSDAKGYQAELNDFYFLADPSSLLLSHYDFEDPLGIYASRKLSLQEFEKYPYEGTRAVAVGFASDDVLRHYRLSNAQPVVDTFDQRWGAFQVSKAPLARQLKAGHLYEFELNSSDFKRLVTFQKPGELVDFQRQGDRFAVKVKPVRGELLVMAATGGAGEYEALLRYEVR